jgi:hypothetical protein
MTKVYYSKMLMLIGRLTIKGSDNNRADKDLIWRLAIPRIVIELRKSDFVHNGEVRLPGVLLMIVAVHAVSAIALIVAIRAHTFNNAAPSTRMQQTTRS